jgi:DNA-directed RNA polymerase specialized sigma24 family protein
MDWTGPDALAAAERHLRLLTKGCEQETLRQWGARRLPLASLAAAGVTGPADVRGWLRSLPSSAADAVLGPLVGLAQDSDSPALLTVIVCLGPGIRTLAVRTGVRTDEAMSEVALGILDFPWERRRSIAGGLLLDARNRLYRAARRAARSEPFGDDDGNHPAAPGELGTTTPPAQRIIQLVCQGRRAGLLDPTEAQLIIDTRLNGHRVKPVAEELGLTPSAVYQRRSRAEARLTALVA